MYKNNLHDLIDSSKNLKNVKPHRGLTAEMEKDVQQIILDLPKSAKDAMCFSAEFEAVPVCKIVPEIFRLPYKKCWFEFDIGDGAIFGILCFQHVGKINTIIFTRPKNEAWLFSCVALLSCIDVDSLNVRAAGVYCDSQKSIVLCLCRYLMALNCCNTKRTEHKPKPSQQSVRRALGRQPLFSTWTLEIDLKRTEQEMPWQGRTHASPRLHLRRGHARQHRPGQWCWVQPHVVGDKSLGMIHKDYATH